MTDTHYVTRRATVEDLPQLTALWILERLPAEALEKRFTEFQVVSNDAGELVAAIGMQVAGTQGLLHNEAIATREVADTLRELLWKRLQVVIQNHALERLWTLLNAHYWQGRGFARATEEQLKLLPAQFAGGQGVWQTITLRAAEANATLEQQMAGIKAMQQQEAARLQERVRWMKRIALGVTIVVFVLWGVLLLKYGPRLFRGH